MSNDTFDYAHRLDGNLGERSVTSSASACAVSAEPAAVNISHSVLPATAQHSEFCCMEAESRVVVEGNGLHMMRSVYQGEESRAKDPYRCRPDVPA